MAEKSSGKIPPKNRELIIGGLESCFSVDKNVVKAILNSQSWNMEKSLKLLESVSPKVTKNTKTKAQNNSKTEINKGKENSKNKDGKNKKNDSNTSKKPGTAPCTPPNNNNLKPKTGDKGKNKQSVSVKENFKIAGVQDPWVYVDVGKKCGAVPKAKQKGSTLKFPVTQVNSPTTQPATSALTKEESENKKKKRALLKSAYDIIKQKSNVADRIRDCIKLEIRVLILMRGCPGSGKSTYAQDLLIKNGVLNTQGHIFSTDNYFITDKGVYNYDRANLDKAHAWNQSFVEKMMKLGLSPIIVDNTHIKAWEMQCYAQFAIRQGYALETVEPPTPWFFNESILAKKNSHSVPKNKIALMLESYESNLSGSDLLKKLGLDYTVQQSPPQATSYSKEAVYNAIKKLMLGKGSFVTNPPKRNIETSKLDQDQTGKLKSNFPPSMGHHDIQVIKHVLLENRASAEQSMSSWDNVFSSPPLQVSSSNQSPQSLYSNVSSENNHYNPSKLLINGDINLIDKPIEDMGNSLILPLKPEFRSSFTNEVDMISLSPTEFSSRSISSSTTSNKIDSNTILPEEKIKKLAELFPHLEKEVIQDLCVDSSQTLDEIVASLLDLNNAVPSVSSEPENNNDGVRLRADSTSDESQSESDDIASGLDMEKEVNMLVQLFPNIEEYKIRDTLKKCENDFKIALEWLLFEGTSENPSETTSETGEVMETYFSQQNEPENNSPNTVAADLSGPYPESKFCLPSQIVEHRTDESHQAVELQNKPPKTNPDCSYSDLIKGSGLKNSVSVDPVRNDVLEGNVSQEKVTDTTGDKINDAGGVHITLDKFEDAMKSAFSALAIKNYEDTYGFIEAGEQLDFKTDKCQSNSSELNSKYSDWNLSDNSKITKLLTKGIDLSPKVERIKFDTHTSSGLRHFSTNTIYKDFDLLKKAQYSDISPEKVLCGTLNFQSCIEPIDKDSVPKNKLMLDKGTSTIEVQPSRILMNDDTEKLLTSMFPTIPSDDLEALLESCVGDLNWAVGLLLDSGHEISSNFNPSEHTIKFNDIVDSTTQCPAEELPLQVPSNETSAKPNSSKKKRNSRILTENINFVMNDEAISSHVRKIRNARLGKVEDSDESPTTSGIMQESNSYDYSEEDYDEEEEETLAVALGTDFILALQAQFGGFIPNVLPDNRVLVNLPVGLARQLHSCIVESLSQQLVEEEKLLTKMIAEDECLARQLQDMENGVTERHQTIQEIMDEELALNIHKSMNKDKSNENTVAGKLARQLLIERFPTMDPLALKSILDDTDHSLYQATQLLEAAGYNMATPPSNPASVSDMVSDDQISREEAIEQANAYREAAKTFFEMRHECFLKAQNAYKEGKKHVASYYSQMANWHNQRIEQANLLASTVLLSGNKNATTVDLHFLRVCEAIQVLDLFIDAHIRNLQEMNARKRQVYVITGRGLHSIDGVSKIRPATISRLKQRSICGDFMSMSQTSRRLFKPTFRHNLLPLSGSTGKYKKKI